MRVMLDTNVLLSVLLFPGKRMNRMMQCIFEEHRLVPSSFVLEELHTLWSANSRPRPAWWMCCTRR